MCIISVSVHYSCKCALFKVVLPAPVLQYHGIVSMHVEDDSALSRASRKASVQVTSRGQHSANRQQASSNTGRAPGDKAVLGPTKTTKAPRKAALAKRKDHSIPPKQVSYSHCVSSCVCVCT